MAGSHEGGKHNRVITMEEFSNAWKKSKKPSKQIKFKANAPLHIKRKLLSARLSKDLTKKHGKRNFPLRKGDKVKIVRGNYYGTTGKVELVDTKYQRVYIENTERIKRDGTKSLYPVHPSNVIITELIMNDKKRKESLERGKSA